jgi:hypothetical protein
MPVKKACCWSFFFRAGDPVSQQTLTGLQKLADAYKESGKLTLLAVSQNTEDETREFAAQLGITFPCLLDRDQYLSMTYGVTTIPTVYLAAGDGRVVRKMNGYRGAILNEMSATVALFAEVAQVTIDENAPMPEPPRLLFPRRKPPPLKGDTDALRVRHYPAKQPRRQHSACHGKRRRGGNPPPDHGGAGAGAAGVRYRPGAASPAPAARDDDAPPPGWLARWKNAGGILGGLASLVFFAAQAKIRPVRL